MKGNCLAIGETIEENCNTYVCGNDNPAKAPVLKFKAPSNVIVVIFIIVELFSDNLLS